MRTATNKVINAGTDEFYIFNGHGDVTGITDMSGNIKKNYEYDAFGNEITTNANDTNPFRYCGEYYDNETGNIYLRARYYDPSMGRFINEDPIKDGVNWYSYCGGNPIRYIDSNGLRFTVSVENGAYVASLLDALSDDKIVYKENKIVIEERAHEISTIDEDSVVHYELDTERMVGTQLVRDLLLNNSININVIVNPPKTNTGVEYGENAFKYDGDGTKRIYLSNTEESEVVTENGNEIIPKYIEFGHELIHAYMYINNNFKDQEIGTYTNSKGETIGVPITEFQAVGIDYISNKGEKVDTSILPYTENKLRAENGLSRRVDY